MSFEEELASVTWVFFDFFDTIVHRNMPDDKIIEKWAINLAPQIGYAVDADELYKYRKIATKKCYAQNQVSEEICYHKIIEKEYTLLHERLAAYSLEKFYNLSYQTELCVERETQCVDWDNVKRIELVKKAGKKVGIISDFYLGSEELKYFLSFQGILPETFDKIYVSSEYGKKKKTGNLYREILNDIQCEAAKCLMIGDNLISDKEKAEECGFKVSYTPYRLEEKYRDAKNALRNIEKRHRTSSFANYAFGIYYFIEQIYIDSIKNKYKKIVFLAREGYLLKELFEIYQSHKSITVQTDYLYASRLSTFLPALKLIEEENFDAILNQYSDISLAAFLKNLQFEEDVIESIADQIGVDQKNIIYNFKNSEAFNKLKNNNMFINLYTKKRNAAFDALKGYMDPIFDDQGTIVIVDVGWKGTMQDNLFKIYSSRKTIGLYYGIFGQTGLECSNNIKKGLVFNQFPSRTKNYYVWEFETHLIEQLFAAPHGSTRGYKSESDKYVPVLEQSEDDKALYSAVKKYQDNIIQAFNEIIEVLSDSIISTQDLFSLVSYAQLRAELFVNSEMIEFEKLALTEKTNNFGWFSMIPLKSGKLSKVKGFLKDIRNIHRQDGNLSIMKYLSYFSIKMNAREKFGWKKFVYRLCFVIECNLIK